MEAKPSKKPETGKTAKSPYSLSVCVKFFPPGHTPVFPIWWNINVTWWCFRTANRQDKIPLFPLPVSPTSTSSRGLVPSASFKKLQKWVLLGGHQGVPSTTVQKAATWPHTLTPQHLPSAPYAATTEFTRARHKGEQKYSSNKKTHIQAVPIF